VISREDVADLQPDEQTYELSSSPVFAFCREVTLLVGVEEQPDGAVRVYLGHRAKGVYLLVEPEQADPFRRAWASGQHVWMAPVPPAERLLVDGELGQVVP
jgi:hypothetical protein